MEVGLIGGTAVKGHMRSSFVVEGAVAADRLACFADAFIGVQIDFLILDGSPETLDEDVVSTRAFASTVMVMPLPISTPVNSVLVN